MTLAIDKDRRILNARNHTAGHLLDYALDKFGMRITAGNGYHFPDGPYVDATISPPLDPATDMKKFMKDVETALNELVLEKRDYTPIMAHPSELPDRTRELLSEAMRESPEVRVLKLTGKADDLLLPCGGTHVPNTSYIGNITVRKLSKKPNGNLRFAYKILPNAEVKDLVY